MTSVRRTKRKLHANERYLSRYGVLRSPGWGRTWYGEPSRAWYRWHGRWRRAVRRNWTAGR